MIDRRLEHRPVLLRRAMAGAWHVPAGFAFLVRNPRLWPLAILPAILAAVCVLAGGFAAFYAAAYVEQWLVPGPGRLGESVGGLMAVLLYVGIVAAGAIVGLSVAMLLSAPILEVISRRVEKKVRGQAVEHDGGVAWEMAESVRAALYFLAATPVVLLLSLVPVVGPIIGTTWAAYALAFQLSDVPLARRGLSFKERRLWHRRWRAESVGFGLTGLLTTIVPCLGLLMLPALTVGATLLVLEFEDGLELAESPLQKQPTAIPPA